MRNRIDLKRPDAPELAMFGALAVGVRTLTLVNPDQHDVLAREPVAGARKDRKLVVELWYPAALGTRAGGQYQTFLRDGRQQVTLQGIAARDARADNAAQGAPLVVISHGFPGNRMLLAHFAEHLASHGYRVAAIDHLDSTYEDPAYQGGLSFASTLMNRPLDTAFVADHLGGDYAIIGYSMGGYGALISAGGGLSQAAMTTEGAPSVRLYSAHRTPKVPARLKAVIPIGPWGRQRDLWDAKGLGRLRLPVLIMAGQNDDVSGYATGMRRIFEEIGGKRWLLTFAAAGHNAAAPCPAPEEAWEASDNLAWPQFVHYGDAVWDTVRMNNIAQHFALAFLDRYLKGRQDREAYLAPGWKGFAEGLAPGLLLEALG